MTGEAVPLITITLTYSIDEDGTPIVGTSVDDEMGIGLVTQLGMVTLATQTLIEQAMDE